MIITSTLYLYIIYMYIYCVCLTEVDEFGGWADWSSKNSVPDPTEHPKDVEVDRSFNMYPLVMSNEPVKMDHWMVDLAIRHGDFP